MTNEQTGCLNGAPLQRFTFDQKIYNQAVQKRFLLMLVVGFVCAGVVVWLALTYKRVATPMIRLAISAACFVIVTAILMVKEWRKQKGNPEKIIAYLSLGHIVGMPFQRFSEILGEPTSLVNVLIAERNNAPGHVAIWSECGYHIVICFDEEFLAVNVQQERLPVS